MPQPPDGRAARRGGARRRRRRVGRPRRPVPAAGDRGDREAAALSRPMPTTSTRRCGCAWSSTSTACASRRALPGWLATTARNEGLRVIKRRARDLPVDPGGTTFDTAEDSDPGEALVQDLRSHALREAMLELPESRRELLLLLLADPPLSYDEISARLGIPRGSIGPTRARALEQLRASRALRGWADEAPVEQGGARDVYPRLTTKGSWRSWPAPWLRWPRCPITAARRPGRRSPGAPSTRSCWRSPTTLSSSPTPPCAARSTCARSASRPTDSRWRSRSTATGSSGRCSTGRSTRSSSSPSPRARSTVPVDSSGIFSVVVPAGQVRFGIRVEGVLRRTPWIVLVPGPRAGLTRGEELSRDHRCRRGVEAPHPLQRRRGLRHGPARALLARLVLSSPRRSAR